MEIREREKVMKTKEIFNLCGSVGNCPTVYKAEDGDYIIQGYVLESDSKEQLNSTEGEDIVRLPKEFVEKMVESLRV